MADLSQLLASSADTKADFNFGKLVDSYWGGLENAYKQRARDAFQDPGLYDAKGNLDPEKAFQQTLRVGGIPAAEAASKLSDAATTRQFYGNAAGMNRDLYGGGGAAGGIVSPPSITQSGAKESVQPDLTQRGSSAAAAPQPQQGGGATVADILTANGIPNSEIGNVSRSLGVDPARPVGLSDPLRQPLIAAIGQFKNNGIGQVYRPGQATPAPQVVQPLNPQVAQGGGVQPQVAPQPPQVQPQPVQPPPQAPVVASDAESQSLGGLISPQLLRVGGGTAQGALNFLEGRLRQGLPPAIAKDVEAQVAAIRSRIGAVEQKGAETRATARATSDVKEQDEYIAAGKEGSKRLFTLNAITNVATNDKNVGFGFGADTELKVKKALQRFGFDFGNLSGAELIEKMNSVLAGEMAKTVTNRPTQFEFKTFLANNPGLLTTREGTVRLAGIYQQLAQRDIDLGKLARSQDNWDNWGDVVDRYDAKHTITDPILKKPIYTNSIVAPGPEGGARPQQPPTAALPPGAPAGARKAGDGNYYVPDPARPGKFLKWVP